MYSSEIGQNQAWYLGLNLGEDGTPRNTPYFFAIYGEVDVLNRYFED
jgi:hypothetical protein